MAVVERDEAEIVKTSPATGQWSGFASVGVSRSTSVSILTDAEESEVGWTVRDIATGIFGVGATMGEAYYDLLVAQREHLDVLERQPELSKDLAEQLEYLRRLLG